MLINLAYPNRDKFKEDIKVILYAYYYKTSFTYLVFS